VSAFLAILVIEHLANPSLDPARHEISEYVHSTIGWLMTIGFLIWSLSLAASACLAGSLRAGGPIRVALLAASLGMLLTACFATQTSAGRLPPDVVLSTTGHLHDLGSGIATVALLLAVLAALRVEGRTSHRLRRVTISLLIFVLPADGLLLALGSEVGGVRQRLLVLAGCVWQLTLISATRQRRDDGQLAPRRSSAVATSKG
jgi:hypothetical protein